MVKVNRISKASPSQQQGPRKTGLRNFAAIPQRAIGDQRLGKRHHRVLGAVCRAVNPDTHCALISQEGISRWANLARTKVGAVIRDLVAWGYLEVIERGKTEHGRFRTHLYKILYDEPGQGDDTPGGDSGVVIPGGELTTSPPEGAESDLPSSDKYWRSDSASDADFAQLSSKQCSEGNEVPDRSGDRSSAGHQYYRLRRSASLCNTAIDLKVATANDQASKLERSGERAIRKRLLDALLSAFPGALSGPALETVSTKAFNKSILLEKDKPGSGIASLIESVEKSLRKIRRA